MPWQRRRRVRRILPLLVVSPLAAWAAASTAIPALASTVVNATIHTPADVQPNPCSPGDWVNLSGDIHIVINTTGNGRDGYQVKNHLNAHLSGASIITGTKFVGNENNNEQWSTGTSLPATHRDTYDFVLVSQGSAANLVLRTTVRETIDAAGDSDVAAERWSTICRGRG
jgi:hypothetical protein